MRRTRAALLTLALALGMSGATAPAPEVITREQWGSRPQTMPATMRHVPKVLTLHHAGTLWKDGDEPYRRLRNLQSWGQRDKGWPDVPYHYLISPDGRIFEGRDVNYRPESNTKYDLMGVVNVHLWGNFDEQRVSVEALRATVAICAELCRRHGLNPEEIRGHTDAAPGQTSCPGKDFQRYIAQGLIRQWVQQTLAGDPPTVALLPPIEGGPTKMITTTAPSPSTP